MITEEKARKKMCPMLNWKYNPTVDELLAGYSNQNCIASDCMAWEWDDSSQWSHCDIVAKSEAEAKHGLEGTKWELKSMRREADGIRRYTFAHVGKRGDCGLKRK